MEHSRTLALALNVACQCLFWSHHKGCFSLILFLLLANINIVMYVACSLTFSLLQRTVSNVNK